MHTFNSTFQIFDPTLVKKKKKKKTTFDLDAALAESEPQQESNEPSSTFNDQADAADDNANLDDLDLENFGKKKKKKKKIGFNLDDLEQALPDDENADEDAAEAENFLIDDSFGSKKKKKKSKDINELLKDNKENEDQGNGKRVCCVLKLML